METSAIACMKGGKRQVGPSESNEDRARNEDRAPCLKLL